MDKDLLFTDVLLPDGNGIKLAETLQKQTLGLPVLLFSDSEDPAIESRCNEIGLNFIRKPFGIKKILDIVNESIIAS